jgi:hypothetical protein
MATAVIDREVAPRRWRWRWRLRLPERLPELKGGWLTAYSLLWVALLVIALVGSIGGAGLMAARGANGADSWAALGLDITGTIQSTRYPRGGVIREVAGRDAEAAGIRVGDVILAVEGRAVPAESGVSNEWSVLDQTLGRVPDGGTVRLLVRESDGKPHRATLIKRQSNAEQIYAGTGLTPAVQTWLSAFAYLLWPLILIVAACLLFGKRRDPVAALLALSFICTACTSGSENLLWLPLVGAAYFSALKVLGTVADTALLTALLTFPRGKFEPRWTLAVAALFVGLDVLRLVSRPNSLPTWIGIPLVVAALLSMVVRYRRAQHDERQQWRWALLGFVVGFGILIPWARGYTAYVESHSGLSTELWAWIIVPMCEAFCASLMVGGITLSVLRYRLYDTSAAVSRSAAYGVLTLGFVALFAGAEKLAEIVGETYFEHSIGIVAGAVGAAVAAAVVVPLHNRVHRWAERRFQKPLIRLREGLPELVSDLRESAPVDQLVSAVMSRVEAGVRSTREAVLLTENGKLSLAGERNTASAMVDQWLARWHVPSGDHALDCDRHDPMFPLRVRLCIETSGEPETIGWLLLGPRPDGSFFGRDEREALAHVAGPVARAIHIAQLREQREEHAERRISGLEVLIEKLVQSLNGGSSKSLVQPR